MSGCCRDRSRLGTCALRSCFLFLLLSVSVVFTDDEMIAADEKKNSSSRSNETDDNKPGVDVQVDHEEAAIVAQRVALMRSKDTPYSTTRYSVCIHSRFFPSMSSTSAAAAAAVMMMDEAAGSRSDTAPICPGRTATYGSFEANTATGTKVKSLELFSFFLEERRLRVESSVRYCLHPSARLDPFQVTFVDLDTPPLSARHHRRSGSNKITLSPSSLLRSRGSAAGGSRSSGFPFSVRHEEKGKRLLAVPPSEFFLTLTVDPSTCKHKCEDALRGFTLLPSVLSRYAELLNMSIYFIVQTSSSFVDVVPRLQIVNGSSPTYATVLNTSSFKPFCGWSVSYFLQHFYDNINALTLQGICSTSRRDENVLEVLGDMVGSVVVADDCPAVLGVLAENAIAQALEEAQKLDRTVGLAPFSSSSSWSSNDNNQQLNECTHGSRRYAKDSDTWFYISFAGALLWTISQSIQSTHIGNFAEYVKTNILPSELYQEPPLI